MIFVKKSCDLDPKPRPLLYDSLDKIMSIVTSRVNESLSSGIVFQCFTLALVKPLLKMAILDPNCLKYYHPDSSVLFMSKVLECFVLKRFCLARSSVTVSVCVNCLELERTENRDIE